MKNIIIRKIFYVLAALALAILSQEAYANITLKAFKGVTKCFKKGKEFYSPTLGKAGLESHLIDIYRFYGNYTAGRDEHGTPQHITDKSNGDPTWDLVRIFFPSPAGHLSAESTRKPTLEKMLIRFKRLHCCSIMPTTCGKARPLTTAS